MVYRFFCAVFLFGAVLVSPTFADKKVFADKMKVDEAELAQVNASVNGVPVKDQSVVVKKDADNPEILQAREREIIKKDIGFFPIGKQDHGADQPGTEHQRPDVSVLFGSVDFKHNGRHHLGQTTFKRRRPVTFFVNLQFS